MVGDTLRAHFEEEARERQREAGGWHGNRYEKIDSSASGNIAGSGKTDESTEKRAESERESRQQAAKLVGTGSKAIDKARTIREHARRIDGICHARAVCYPYQKTEDEK